MSEIFGVKSVGGIFADENGEIPMDELNSSNLRLNSYPNTRNDGQLTTNKILTTDEQGYVKLCSIAVAPAPYLEVLVPDSTLPSTTTNFILKGAFFTPNMTVEIEGQTINYVTFVSDNLVKVNVTTSEIEGNYAVTLNNGISTTFPKALMIVLGEVFVPTDEDWIDLFQPIDFSNGMPVVETFGGEGSAIWDKEFDTSKNISIRFSFGKSPLGGIPSDGTTKVFSFIDATTSVELFFVRCRSGFYGFEPFSVVGGVEANTDGVYYYSGVYGNYDDLVKDIGELRYISGIWYFYLNNSLKHTFTQHTNYTNNIKLKVNIKQHDTKNIKYIELQT